MKEMIAKSFHRKQWLNIQQAVNYLSAVSEEPLTSSDLADLAENYQLDLYWYRPGQMLSYTDHHGRRELSEPLRLCAENHSDWHAIANILRHRPALPSYEQDTPLMEDAEGNRLRITFDYGKCPEPFSSRWYPSFAELMLKRIDLEQLEPRIFSARESIGELEPRLLLDVIWQLEQMALDDEHPQHTPSWLAEQLARRSDNMDRASVERVLAAAESHHTGGTAY